MHGVDSAVCVYPSHERRQWAVPLTAYLQAQAVARQHVMLQEPLLVMKRCIGPMAQ